MKPTPGVPADKNTGLKTRRYANKEKRKKGTIPTRSGQVVSCPYTVGEFETWMLLFLVVVAVGVFSGAF